MRAWMSKKDLDTRLVQMANVGRGLAGLLANHQALGINQAKRVNNDLSLYRLNGIDNDSNSTFIEGFKALN
jgi:hypothetical protein